MATITAANAVLMLAVTGLFPVPQQIQGFAAEDIYDTEDLETAETLMGVDGKLSAGFIYAAVKQKITLQADSASNDFFEALYRAEAAAREKYRIQGSIALRSTNKLYTMTQGVMSGYKPLPDGKKVLQPRPFTITWERVSPGAL